MLITNPNVYDAKPFLTRNRERFSRMLFVRALAKMPSKPRKRQIMTEDGMGNRIDAAAVPLHREHGPERLETVYEVILVSELRRRGLPIEWQVPIAIEGLLLIYCFLGVLARATIILQTPTNSAEEPE